MSTFCFTRLLRFVSVALKWISHKLFTDKPKNIRQTQRLFVKNLVAATCFDLYPVLFFSVAQQSNSKFGRLIAEVSSSQTDRQTDGRTDGRTDGQTDRQTDTHTHRHAPDRTPLNEWSAGRGEPSFDPKFEQYYGITQSVQRLARGWTGRRSNPGGGRDFPHHPDRPWGPPSLLYNGYRVFAGDKAAGAWRWPPTPSIAEVKKRVELYFYSRLVCHGLF